MNFNALALKEAESGLMVTAPAVCLMPATGEELIFPQTIFSLSLRVQNFMHSPLRLVPEKKEYQIPS